MYASVSLVVFIVVVVQKTDVSCFMLHQPRTISLTLSTHLRCYFVFDIFFMHTCTHKNTYLFFYPFVMHPKFDRVCVCVCFILILLLLLVSSSSLLLLLLYLTTKVVLAACMNAIHYTLYKCERISLHWYFVWFFFSFSIREMNMFCTVRVCANTQNIQHIELYAIDRTY